MNKNAKKSELPIASLESHSRQITRKATGPRTAAGKERSKRNAHKHGIFSRAVLLPNESQAEFDSLLGRLGRDCQPVGAREELSVERLATHFWRYRRFLIAEAAEIQKGGAFLQWEQRDQQEIEAQESSHNNSLDVFADEIGITRKMANPRVLDKCLNVLNKVQIEFERNAFTSKFVVSLLIELYGSSDHCVDTLLDSYLGWKVTSECSNEEREQNGYASVEDCKSHFRSALQREIERVDEYKKASALIQAERMSLESLRRNVPESPQLDRLLKYEASLNRDIDRTLTQLERLQRMRLGQPVSSPIKLDISSS